MIGPIDINLMGIDGWGCNNQIKKSEHIQTILEAKAHQQSNFQANGWGCSSGEKSHTIGGLSTGCLPLACDVWGTSRGPTWVRVVEGVAAGLGGERLESQYLGLQVSWVDLAGHNHNHLLACCVWGYHPR